MRIDVISIFPKMFEPVLNESIIKRAQNKGKVKIHIHDLRDCSNDKHRKVDDRPFGGGSGMVMRAEPIFKAVEDILGYQLPVTSYQRRPEAERRKSFDKLRTLRRRTLSNAEAPNTKVVLLTPQGKTLTQGLAKRLAKHRHLILICGHYEGVDERVRQYLINEEISIGDYILTGGELPAMILIDCLVRLIPGVLGDKNSLNFESFEGNLLEYPQYTRPADFQGMKVPPILLSGDHKRIESWRKDIALERTKQRRPDLICFKRRC